MKQRVYLDNNAGTFVDPDVLQAVIQNLQSSEGNPSSIHAEGQAARQRLTLARQVIADYLKVKSKEIIFTSGGTEALNTMLRGFCQSYPKAHVITSLVEHSSVYQTALLLQQQGCDVTFLPTGLMGTVTADAVKKALKPSTRLIVLMAVNNETGVKTDIESIAGIAQASNAFFLVDGVALLGKESFSIPAGVSAMCFSGHKVHAPKGVGFLFWRTQMHILPMITGGHQEFNRRAGTENIPGIVGLSKAVSLLNHLLPEATERMRMLRDYLEEGLLSALPFAVVNGEGPRVVNTLNMSFPGIDGEALLMHLDRKGIAVSLGSACSSGAIEPSRILLNMGMPMELARSAVRFSLSRFTTKDEIDTCIETVVALVSSLRG